MSKFKPVVELFATMFNPLIGILLALYSAVQWVARTMTGTELELGNLRQSYDDFQEAVGTAAFGTFPSPMQSALAFVNYTVPLTEGIVLIALLCTLYIFCATFRIVKSWIPTIG